MRTRHFPLIRDPTLPREGRLEHPRLPTLFNFCTSNETYSILFLGFKYFFRFRTCRAYESAFMIKVDRLYP